MSWHWNMDGAGEPGKKFALFATSGLGMIGGMSLDDMKGYVIAAGSAILGLSGAVGMAYAGWITTTAKARAEVFKSDTDARAAALRVDADARALAIKVEADARAASIKVEAEAKAAAYKVESDAHKGTCEEELAKAHSRIDESNERIKILTVEVNDNRATIQKMAGMWLQMTGVAVSVAKAKEAGQ